MNPLETNRRFINYPDRQSGISRNRRNPERGGGIGRRRGSFLFLEGVGAGERQVGSVAIYLTTGIVIRGVDWVRAVTVGMESGRVVTEAEQHERKGLTNSFSLNYFQPPPVISQRPDLKNQVLIISFLIHKLHLIEFFMLIAIKKNVKI